MNMHYQYIDFDPNLTIHTGEMTSKIKWQAIGYIAPAKKNCPKKHGMYGIPMM